MRKGRHIFGFDAARRVVSGSYTFYFIFFSLSSPFRIIGMHCYVSQKWEGKK